MTYLREVLSQVVTSLLRNKLRSFLTMAGIAWGMASIVLIVAMGDGFKMGQRANIKPLGENIVLVFPGRTEMQAGGQRAGRRIRPKYDDIRDIRAECFLVDKVTCEMQTSTRAVSQFNSGTFNTIGVEPLYAQMRTMPIAEGRFHNDEEEREARRVCVLGDNVRKQLFGERPSVLGAKVAINGLPFRVVGLMSAKTQNSSYNGLDSDKIYIPYTHHDAGRAAEGPELPAGHVQQHDLRAGFADGVESGAAAGDARARAQPRLRPGGQRRGVRLGHGGAGRAGGQHLHFDDGVPGQHRGGDADAGRRGRHEHHAGVGDGADARDRAAQGGGRHAPAHPGDFLLEGVLLAGVSGVAGFLGAYGLAAMVNCSRSRRCSRAAGERRHHGHRFAALALIAIASAVWPAWRAASLTPVEALRYER